MFLQKFLLTAINKYVKVEKNNNLILFGDINQEVEDSSEDDGKKTIEPGYDADVDSDVDEGSYFIILFRNFL